MKYIKKVWQTIEDLFTLVVITFGITMAIIGAVHLLHTFVSS